MKFTKKKKIAITAVGIVMLGMIAIGSTTKKEDGDITAPFVISDEETLEIISIEPYVNENNLNSEVLVGVTYKYTGEGKPLATYLKIISEDRFAEIQNNEVLRLERLDTNINAGPALIKNEDGTTTVYFSQSGLVSDNAANYKAIIVTNYLGENEKAVVADIAITDDVIEQFTETTQEWEEKVALEKEEQSDEEIEDRIGHKMYGNNKQFETSLYIDENIHLTDNTQMNHDFY